MCDARVNEFLEGFWTTRGYIITASPTAGVRQPSRHWRRHFYFPFLTLPPVCTLSRHTRTSQWIYTLLCNTYSCVTLSLQHRQLIKSWRSSDATYTKISVIAPWHDGLQLATQDPVRTASQSMKLNLTRETHSRMRQPPFCTSFDNLHVNLKSWVKQRQEGRSATTCRKPIEKWRNDASPASSC